MNRRMLQLTVDYLVSVFVFVVVYQKLGLTTITGGVNLAVGLGMLFTTIKVAVQMAHYRLACRLDEDFLSPEGTSNQSLALLVLTGLMIEGLVLALMAWLLPGYVWINGLWAVLAAGPVIFCFIFPIEALLFF